MRSPSEQILRERNSGRRYAAGQDQSLQIWRPLHGNRMRLRFREHDGRQSGLGYQCRLTTVIMYAFHYLRSDRLVLQALTDAHCYHWIEYLDTEESEELELRSQLPRSFLLGVELIDTRSQYGRKKRRSRCDTPCMYQTMKWERSAA
ncbi:hypothetical protein SVAN01_08030 [Stagonosporopsis vannaccii]|nr:hypothetical protein SVAN01_08030 [Stagonosporopsis vannaccii]